MLPAVAGLEQASSSKANCNTLLKSSSNRLEENRVDHSDSDDEYPTCVAVYATIGTRWSETVYRNQQNSDSSSCLQRGVSLVFLPL